MPEYEDFKEIDHCGGQATIQIVADAEGRKMYSIGQRHSSPRPASLIGLYVHMPHGTPVINFRLGGIGQAFDPPCPDGCVPVFMGSDSQMKWGFECPRCKGYFRHGQDPAIYPITCTYCGLRTNAAQFATKAQRKYLEHFAEKWVEGMNAEMAPNTEREIVIDMDALVAQDGQQLRPDFYCATESQQTVFSCLKCGGFNDIRGRYGYCASCGWRNNKADFESAITKLRNRLNEHQITPQTAVQTAISECGSCCRDYVTQLAKRVPMKLSRKRELESFLFHNIESPVIEALKKMFDIDLLRDTGEETSFLRMMEERRHVFEHNGGVADQRYIDASGDSDVRLGALIRETQPNAHRLMNVLSKMMANIDADFHEIFRPTEAPINHYQQEESRRRERQSTG